jgi:hypothetical protein
MDDLDVRIALRDFEEAVRSIEKGNAGYHPILTARTTDIDFHGYKTGDLFPLVASPVASDETTDGLHLTFSGLGITFTQFHEKILALTCASGRGRSC